MLLFDALDAGGAGMLSADQLKQGTGALQQALAFVQNEPKPSRVPVPTDLQGQATAIAFHHWADGWLTEVAAQVPPKDLAEAVTRVARSQRPPFFPWSGYDADRAAVSEILPAQLYLSNWRGAANREALVQLQITHIASMGTEFVGEEPCADLGIQYFAIEVDDTEEQAGEMQTVLAQVVEWIDKAIVSGGRVVVHCAAGISRSATVVLAYLVAQRSMSLRTAYEHIRTARSVVWPNTGFMRILIAWEQRCRGPRGTMRLQQWELWSNHDEEQYSLAKVVDRD